MKLTCDISYQKIEVKALLDGIFEQRIQGKEVEKIKRLIAKGKLEGALEIFIKLQSEDGLLLTRQFKSAQKLYILEEMSSEEWERKQSQIALRVLTLI